MPLPEPDPGDWVCVPGWCHRCGRPAHSDVLLLSPRTSYVVPRGTLARCGTCGRVVLVAPQTVLLEGGLVHLLAGSDLARDTWRAWAPSLGLAVVDDRG